jgi:hypothetical protein
MTSAVSICSNALLLLGARPINSFEESVTVDGLNRAQLCANLWPSARDALLRMHPWNCAKKRVVLSPETTTPPFEYAFQFALPGDWLRCLSINEIPEDKYDYNIESRKLLAHEETIYLRYIWRNEDPASWDASLVECAELFVAHKIAYTITGQTTLRDSFLQEVQFKLRQARAIDGVEEPPETLGDSPLLNARHAGSPRRGV